jgi:hypothetical protein
LPKLPAGEMWVDYFAREKGDAVGPGRLTVPTTDLNVFPLFMRVKKE